MHVTNRLQELRKEIRSFGLCQAFPPLDHFVHTLVVTKLQKNVTVATILKVVLVLTDVLVFQRTMNLDFRLQL